MTDEQSPYSYQGQVFESKEAMELYIASRSPNAAKYSGTSGTRKASQTLRYLVVGGFTLVVVSCIFQSKSPVQKTNTQTESRNANGASEGSKNTLALLINMHGELCASVTDVARIAGDVYRVTCTRYRDGTGSATFEVNAATGSVK